MFSISQTFLPKSSHGSHFHINSRDSILDQQQPSKEMLNLYKEKLERSRMGYDDLISRFQSLNEQNQQNFMLSMDLQAAEAKIKKLTDMLSKTQALLITERKQSQQMALHIDMLQQQHEMDKEKLDQLLSLDGKTVARHTNKTEIVLQHKIHHLEKLLREQAASLMEERAVMKSEWDRERQMNERSNKQLKEKVHKLQEDLVKNNQQLASLGRQSLEDFINGGTGDEVYYHLYENNTDPVDSEKPSHCSQQEMKKLKNQVELLKEEVSNYQKKNLSQAGHVKQFADQLRKSEERFQTLSKTLKEQISKLKQQNEDLNKRRLTEGSGFRSEIQLLKEQLQRTQRQLCYLTVRKLQE